MTDFLPIEFQNKMKELLGDEFNSFLNVYEQKHFAGIRVNTLKLSPKEFEKLSPVPITPVRWTENGYYYDENLQPAKHPYYYAGLYYIQEPSAMTPASLLPVVPGDKVLDICAAPGGKSTELGARLKGRGVLVSNDISNSRAKALLKNVELFGIRNAVVISEAPVKLSDTFEEYFDKILVDAPCSGEGMFRKSHAIIKNWEQYGTGYYAKLQREILPQVVKMLKPGGYMVYSTCTFSVEEDESTLKFLTDEYPELEVIQAADLQDSVYEGFAPARPELVGGAEELSYGLRLYPHRINGEGHFIALLRKRRADEEKGSIKVGCSRGKFVFGEVAAVADEAEFSGNHYSDSEIAKSPVSKEALLFFEQLGFEIPINRLLVKEERVYLLPEDIPNMKGLRVMRSGLLLGEMKKGRFEPSQALACALHMQEYGNTYNMSADNADVIKYLKCETITVPDEIEDGYVLICVDGYPLGWGKVHNHVLKNKYLPGWRML